MRDEFELFEDGFNGVPPFKLNWESFPGLNRRVRITLLNTLNRNGNPEKFVVEFGNGDELRVFRSTGGALVSRGQSECEVTFALLDGSIKTFKMVSTDVTLHFSEATNTGTAVSATVETTWPRPPTDSPVPTMRGTVAENENGEVTFENVPPNCADYERDTLEATNTTTTLREIVQERKICGVSLSLLIACIATRGGVYLPIYVVGEAPRKVLEAEFEYGRRLDQIAREADSERLLAEAEDARCSVKDRIENIELCVPLPPRLLLATLENFFHNHSHEKVKIAQVSESGRYRVFGTTDFGSLFISPMRGRTLEDENHNIVRTYSHDMRTDLLTRDTTDTSFYVDVFACRFYDPSGALERL